jgi:DNA-directed RNA polymerase subunit L
MSTTKKKTIKGKDLIAARERLYELKAIQNNARDEELKIREYLANSLHDGEEGSKTFKIDGEAVTITRTLTRTIGQAEAEEFVKLHGDLSLECLRWKPEVKVAGYKAHREILDEYIVTKAGPPSVAFK